MVLSASSVSALDTYGSSWYIALRQLIWLVVGVVACAFVMRRDYHRWRRWSLPALGVTGVLMALVLVPGIGMNVNGASRWLGYGPFSLQPSELAKITVLLFAADLLARRAAWLHRPAAHAASGRCRVRRDRLPAHAAAEPRHHAGARGDRPVGALRRRGPAGPARGRRHRRRRRGHCSRARCQLPPGPRPGVPRPVGRPAEHRLPEHPVARRHRLRRPDRRRPRRRARPSGASCPYAHTDFIFAIVAEELGLFGALAVVCGVRGAVRAGRQGGPAGTRPLRDAAGRRASPRGSASRRS